MKTYAKFGALVALIIGVLVWLAMGGISDSKTYYKTIAELGQMGDQAKGKRLRVGGDVQAGSIVRNGAEVTFVMHQDAEDAQGGLQRHRSAAGHVQGWRAGSGGREAGTGRRIPGQQDPGQVRIEVRSQAPIEDGREGQTQTAPADQHGSQF